jgi:hypothetical protein
MRAQRATETARQVQHALAGRSEEFAELLGGQASIAHNTAHRERVDRIVARDGEDAFTIGHHHVLAFPNDAEARLLERTNGVEMVDSGIFPTR